MASQRPAGGALYAERGMERHLANPPAGRVAEGHLPRRRQPVRPQRHRAKRVLLAQGAHGRRLDLERGAGAPVTHRHQRPAEREEVGLGADRGPAQAGSRLDLRRTDQPHLVGCRRQRTLRHQHHVRAALSFIHHAHGLDVCRQHRKHLRLEKQTVERPAQPVCLESHQDRHSVDQCGRRRALLGRRADGSDSGPHGWGLRLVATLLFPK